MTYDEKIKYYKLVGKNIRHIKYGDVYKILMLTNMNSPEIKDYPPSFVYQGQNGSKWSSPLSLFNDNFRVVDDYDALTLKLITYYRDGGTALFKDSFGNNYFRDGRIGSNTHGKWFDKYPGEKDAKELIFNINHIID